MKNFLVLFTITCLSLSCSKSHKSVSDPGELGALVFEIIGQINELTEEEYLQYFLEPEVVFELKHYVKFDSLREMKSLQEKKDEKNWKNELEDYVIGRNEAYLDQRRRIKSFSGSRGLISSETQYVGFTKYKGDYPNNGYNSCSSCKDPEDGKHRVYGWVYFKNENTVFSVIYEAYPYKGEYYLLSLSRPHDYGEN